MSSLFHCLPFAARVVLIAECLEAIAELRDGLGLRAENHTEETALEEALRRES